VDLDKLEKLASEATPGPWRSQWGQVFSEEPGTILLMAGEQVTTDELYANADFVTVVKSEIAELIRLARLGAAVEAMPRGDALVRVYKMDEHVPGWEWEYLRNNQIHHRQTTALGVITPCLPDYDPKKT
jgi:hypothetical protein